MVRQQEISYQLDLFSGQFDEDISRSDTREDVNRARARKEKQVDGEGKQRRVLTKYLMAAVCSHPNLKQAYRQVKQNKGSAGIDQMPVGKFSEWFNINGELLIESLLSGNYQPQAVKQVEIPKPKGGTRKLGIPTVTDRIIQQAIAQILTQIYELEFSEFSYGFRPKRGAQMTLRQAKEYVASGREVVVDMDMKSFFDEVNHDRLMFIF